MAAPPTNPLSITSILIAVSAYLQSASSTLGYPFKGGLGNGARFTSSLGFIGTKNISEQEFDHYPIPCIWSKRPALVSRVRNS